MLLKQLIIHNIRSYIHETIIFPKGTVLLSGDIGSGKSTILLGIAFALFGADTEKLSGQALLRKGAADAFVELNFQLGNTEITIRRGLKKQRGTIAQTDGWITKNGVKKDAMPIELKAEMVKLLGYPESIVTKKKNFIYTYTVYCPQEEMRAILGDDKEMRIDTLRRIFGIDKYKQMRENASIMLKELRAQQRELGVQVIDISKKQALRDEKKNHAAQLQLKEHMLTPRIADAHTRHNQVKAKLIEHEKKLSEHIEQRRRKDIFQEQLRMNQELGARHQEKISRLTLLAKSKQNEPIEIIEKLISEKESELQATMTLQQTIMQKKNFVDKKLIDIEREIQSKKIVIDIIKVSEERSNLIQVLLSKKDIIEQQQRLQKQQEHVRTAKTEYQLKEKSARETIERIHNITTCPTCMQAVSDDHKSSVKAHQDETLQLCEERVAEQKKEEEQLQLELSKIASTLMAIEAAEKRIARIDVDLEITAVRQKAIDEKKLLMEQLKEEQTQLMSEQQKIASIDTNAIRQSVKELREKRDAIIAAEHAEQEMKKLHEEKQSIQEKISAAQTEIAKLEPIVAQILEIENAQHTMRQELEQISNEERELLIQRAHTAAERKAAEQQLAMLEQEIAEKEATAKKSQKIGQLCDWLDGIFMPLTAAIEKHVMRRVYMEFSEPFKKWYALLVADENMAARIDDNFSPVIEQNGYEVDSAYLSGGERTSAALAYRLALNKVVNGMIDSIKTRNILILDEPTDGFSSEQLDRMRDVISELDAQQIVLVSHEQKIESFVEQTIRIVKENGVSRVAT